MHKMKYQYHNPKVVSYDEEETIKNLLLYHEIQEILDFSIGDTVYQNKHNYCTPLTVKRIIIEENDIIYETDTQKFTKADIGKTIFYTFDDAKTYDLLFSKQDMIGKRYQNPKGIANGHICEVTANPDNWGTCQVKDLKTQKEFLCSKEYILDHELKDENIRTIFVGNKTQEEITNWIKSNTKLGTIYAAFEGGVDAEILIINESLADLYLPNGERKINIPLEDVAKVLKEVTLNKQQDEMEMEM